MRKMAAILFVAGMAALAGSGCVSAKFDRLPSPAEFTKPLAQLQQEYLDLTKYEVMPLFVWNMPEAEPLRQAWGEPRQVKYSWWGSCMSGFLTNSCSTWQWQFEDKDVYVLIIHPIAYGWRPHVRQLLVEEKKKEKEAPVGTGVPK